jgi:hypothetical protein
LFTEFDKYLDSYNMLAGRPRSSSSSSSPPLNLLHFTIDKTLDMTQENTPDFTPLLPAIILLFDVVDKRLP